MLFFPVHPTFWDDPGQFPVSRWRRRLYKFLGGTFFAARPKWIEQWLLYMEELERQAEAYQMYLDQVAEYELMQQLYLERGEELAAQLPYELHLMELSRVRTMRDRKDDRPYEKVDYCSVEYWYWDEYAFYFWIATWYPKRPYGVTIDKFYPNQPENNRVAMTLTGAFGAQVAVEFNDDKHQRPGLWIVVEHKSGRGDIPNMVSYQEIMKHFPKTAGQLAYPVGITKNKKILLADLDEIHNLGIGGSPGGGKSNKINLILTTIINRNTPQDVRFFMVDFKRVELSFYKDIPHLGGETDCVMRLSEDKEGKPKKTITKTVPMGYQPKEGEKIYPPLGQKIITEPKDFPPLLDYLLAEYERRSIMLEKAGMKKIGTWNKRRPKNKMPYLILVVDELADVMLRYKAKVEEPMARLNQLGRFVGIYTIYATQTPKSNIITGLISNTILGWHVFRCGSPHGSATMLNGKWDAANLPAIQGRSIFREGDDMIEVQTPLITDLTIKQAVRAAKERGFGPTQLQVQNWTIPPEQVFEYALTNLDGYCAESTLYKYFRRSGVTLKEMRELLRAYQVVGSHNAFEPEIEIGEEEYYLAPAIVGSRTPRQLIPVTQFEQDFESVWTKHLTRHTSHGAENSETGGGTDENFDELDQPTDPLDLPTAPIEIEGQWVNLDLEPLADETELAY